MVDYPTIALLPWLIIEDEVVVGGVHFVPWQRRAKSSNVNFISQECARKIMSVYKDIDGRVIDRAVLAYHEHQGTKGQLPEALFEEIFEASNILAFSALSEKEYFNQVGQNKSVNSAYFRTVLQRFQEPCKVISHKIRILDGKITNIDEMKSLQISKPLQCIVKPVDIDRFKFNDALIKAVYNAKFGNDRCKRLKSAIRQFISATKCDDWIVREQEYLDLIISYECLFDRVNSATDFADKISQILDGYGSVRLQNSTRICGKTIANRDQSRFLHYEFLKEGYKLRNIYAHGKSIGNMPLIWKEKEHYIFGCWLFPLVVKKILQDEGYYVLNDDDEICLRSIDKLLYCEKWGDKYILAGKRINITNWQNILQETKYDLAKDRAIEEYRRRRQRS